MIDFVKVGQRLAERRKALGISQEELADKLYVTRQAISKWENGMSLPSIDVLCEISRFFAVSTDEILGLFESAPASLDSSDIFRGHDRSYIVGKIANGEIKVNLSDCFYQMSAAERIYILKHIKENKLKTDMRELWVKLTPSEQEFLGGNSYEI